MTCVAQLAGRDDDQGLRGVGELLGLGAPGLDVGGDGDPLQEREAEAQRLAGAGLGLADDVVAREGDGERHLLDGEGSDDADGLEGLGGLGKDPEARGRSWWSGCCLFCGTRRGRAGGRVGPCRGTATVTDRASGRVTAGRLVARGTAGPRACRRSCARHGEEGGRVGADRATDRASSSYVGPPRSTRAASAGAIPLYPGITQLHRDRCSRIRSRRRPVERRWSDARPVLRARRGRAAGAGRLQRRRSGWLLCAA